MAPSKRPRPSRTSRKQAAVAPEEGVVPSTTPSTAVFATAATATAATVAATTAATVAATTAAPITPTPAKGIKRRRGEEDENDEDAFYGRKSAKNRNKGLGDFEKKNEQEQKDTTKGKGFATPVKTPVTTSSGSSKRLKFDPEVHGVGLEARLLSLQDGFEKMISPRKNTRIDGEKEKPKRDLTEPAKTPQTNAKSRPAKVELPIKTSKVESEEGGPVQTKGFFESQSLGSKSLTFFQEKEVPANGSIPALNSASLALEKRLQRLTSSAISNTSPARPRIVGSAFSGSLAPVKSLKPLTKPSFELPGDAHMRKRAAEREERKKRMEEAEKQREETRKQQQLHERFKTHIEQRVTKRDHQQGPPPKAPAVPCAHTSAPRVPGVSPTTLTTIIAINPESEPAQPSIPRRFTIDEANQQLNNESELEEKKKAEEAVLRLRQEAAEKGKESARLWAEQMKTRTKEPGA